MNKIIEKKPELIAMGAKLKALREEKGKSQKEAALDLELKNQSVLSSYELGDREPPFVNLNKIARYYDVTVDYLTGNSDIRNSDTERLSKALPFNEKTIAKLLKLSSDTNGLFEELLSSESLSLFFIQIYEYINISSDQVDRLANATHPNMSSKLPLEIAAIKISVRRNLLRGVLFESLESLSLDIEKIRTDNVLKAYSS